MNRLITLTKNKLEVLCCCCFINSISGNPVTLNAPSIGTYTVFAGYKNEARDWESNSAIIDATGVDEILIGLNPSEFKLYANYPNPLNSSTKIRYAITQTALTTLIIYSLIGQEVSTLINEEKSPPGFMKLILMHPS
jgi:hypothetical protein